MSFQNAQSAAEYQPINAQMKNAFTPFFLVALTLIATPIVRADEPTSAFLMKHCLRCHGTAKQKADRRFDTLPVAIEKLDDLERFQEIVDQLNLGSMPPEDETQPTASERATAIAHLTQEITAADPT